MNRYAIYYYKDKNGNREPDIFNVVECETEEEAILEYSKFINIETIDNDDSLPLNLRVLGHYENIKKACIINLDFNVVDKLQGAVADKVSNLQDKINRIIKSKQRNSKIDNIINTNFLN